MGGDKTQDVQIPAKDALSVNESLDTETIETGGITSYQKFKFYEDLETIGKLFDHDLFEKISQVDHIKKTEQHLEEMKVTITDKKKLQKERNVLTAQLSRDRKKLEVELLRQNCL